jgi:hypothetical protein
VVSSAEDRHATGELERSLATLSADEAAGRGISELEARRDLFLVDLLALKAGRG